MDLRTRITERVVELLTSKRLGGYVTDAQERVYKQRYPPLSDKGDSSAFLPALCVFVTHETVERIDWTQSRRTLDLDVECYVTGQTADDDLGNLINQVEIELQRDDTLNGLVEWTRLKEISWTYDKGSESLIQGAKVTYEVTYITQSTSTLPLDDFKQADVETEVAGHALADNVEPQQ